MQSMVDNQHYKSHKKLINFKADSEISQEKWKQPSPNSQCVKQISLNTKIKDSNYKKSIKLLEQECNRDYNQLNKCLFNI
jgi:hypothetical protein